MDSESTAEVRGDGGEELYQPPVRKDVALLAKAIRERWPIPAANRTKLQDYLMQILAEGKNERARVSAAKVIVDTDWLNLESEKFEAGKASQEESGDTTKSSVDALGQFAAILRSQEVDGGAAAGDAQPSQEPPAVDAVGGAAEPGVPE